MLRPTQATETQVRSPKCEIEELGFALLRDYLPGGSAMTVARHLGAVFSPSATEIGSAIHDVQVLRPQAKDAEKGHLYHGNFGYAEYPAHTDLAHWHTPPRYLMLRAKEPAPDVFTALYTPHGSLQQLPEKLVDSAVFAARKGPWGKVAMPMRITKKIQHSIRWDPLFITPLNDSAHQCKQLIEGAEFYNRRREISLNGSSDTLIVDNWRVLHGRSAVPLSSVSRVLERVYLKEIYA